MNRATLIIALALGLATLSCRATVPAKRPLAPVYNGPVSAEALADRIAFSGISGLRAEIMASFYSGRKHVGTFKGAMVMRPPDDMRVVLYDNFGNTVMDMVRADGSLEILVPSKDTIYLGQAPSMMPQEGSTLEVSLIENENGRSEYLLTAGKQGHGTRQYQFDARTALNIAASVRADNGWLMEARFMDHLYEREGNIPGSVVLSYGPDFRLEFNIKDLEASEIPARLIPLGRTASNVYELSELEEAE